MLDVQRTLYTMCMSGILTYTRILAFCQHLIGGVMLLIKRSASKIYWDVCLNDIMIERYHTKREAMSALETYKRYEGML